MHNTGVCGEKSLSDWGGVSLRLATGDFPSGGVFAFAYSEGVRVVMNTLIGPSCFIEDLQIGMSANTTRSVTEDDIVKFAEVSGDHNPLHFDEAFAAGTKFGGRVAHGMLTASFISALFGNQFPGPGCIYISQTLKFKAPVRIGDTVKVEVTLTDLRATRNRATFRTIASVDEKVVIEGEAVAHVPSRP